MGEKGRYASATEGRRLVWGEIVWPLVLEVNDTVFSAERYRKKRDEVARAGGADTAKMSRGLASLVQKGMLYKEGGAYGIHYRLIPYMRLKAECDYATAVQEAQSH